MQVIMHNNKPVFVCADTDSETKISELRAANSIAKNFQVPESDKWEAIEVPCG